MDFMNDTNSRISRTQVGILAALCLAIALGIWAFSPESQAALAAFLRVGIVMSALWFAVPAKGAKLAWDKILPILVGGIVLIALSRKLIIVALPLSIAVGLLIYFLRPRPKQRPGERAD